MLYTNNLGDLDVQTAMVLSTRFYEQLNLVQVDFKLCNLNKNVTKYLLFLVICTKLHKQKLTTCFQLFKL